MYVIVDIAGQQFKVEKDQKIFVHRLEGNEGDKVDFDQVLLVDNDGKVEVGMPVVKNRVVSASILAHVKGDKVKVFKKKRRKGYRVLNGHRQSFTQLLIENIGEGQAKAKAVLKKEAEPKASATDDQVDIVVEEKTKAAPKTKTVTAKEKPAAKETKTNKEKKESGSKSPAAMKSTTKSATKAAPKEKKVAKKGTKE